jgi:hypothetical protein
MRIGLPQAGQRRRSGCSTRSRSGVLVPVLAIVRLRLDSPHPALYQTATFAVLEKNSAAGTSSTTGVSHIWF